MVDWNPWSLRPQITSIFIVTLILATLIIIYNIKLKKTSPYTAPKGFVLVVQIYINFIRNLVIEILGPRLEKLTPFFLFLFSYICLSNLISVFGLENPTASYTVTLSLGLMGWIGTFVIGFKYQRLSFLKTYCINIKVKNKFSIPIMINPLEIAGAISPLISLSLRLWGNIFAGSLIALLWQFMTAYIWAKIPVIGVINLLGGITIVPIHLYFDILCGVIQALVFSLLIMVYWTLAKGESEISNNINLNTNIPKQHKLMYN